MSHSLIVFFIFAHFAHLRERVFTQHRLFVFKHNWQNVVASFLILRIRSTVTWWLWSWLKFSTFMTNNLYSNRKWVIKWLNDEKANDEKMLFYVQNYSFIFSYAASFFISFMIIDLRFRHIIFEQRIFLIIVFDRQREFLSSFIQYQDKHTNSINWLTSMWAIHHSIARKSLC
jgi:hypothetical protein